jgi:hypothetical protein
MEIKFELLKRKAKEEFINLVEICKRGDVYKASWVEPYEMLIAFSLMARDERKELRDFAETFQGKKHDYIAGHAKDGNAWAQTLLKVREAGIDVIDNWDVRRVGKLVELFPSIVPQKFHNANIVAEMVDNETGDDCDWVVFFETERPSYKSSAPGM